MHIVRFKVRSGGIYKDVCLRVWADTITLGLTKEIPRTAYRYDLRSYGIIQIERRRG